MQFNKLTSLTPQLSKIVKSSAIRSNPSRKMSLLPRISPFAPMRHDFAPLVQMVNDMQRISESVSHHRFSPNFDVKEDKDTYILEGEVPGINQKDITIEFSDDQTLTIKGRTEHRREEGQRPGTVTEEKEEAKAGEPHTSDSKEVAQTGSKEVAHPAPKHTYWVSERSIGEFARSFSFPNRVDQNNVKASLKDGILSVVLPKLAKQNLTKRINIE